MKVLLARTSGFCSGVQSAIIKISKSLNRYRSIGIDGDLIHNPQTTLALRKRGLINIPNEVVFAGPVAIRTHGTTENDIRKKKQACEKLINLTCPKVSRVQGIIKKHARGGFHIIITGDTNHAEVISLQSYATSGCTVIHSPDEIKSVPHAEKYLLVSQTTFEKDRFSEIRAEAEKSLPGIVVIPTICDSTFHRQNELINAIKNGIDSLIVIGGKKSANTRSLASIGTARNITTAHIETADELIPAHVSGSKNLFVTAGASTPRWIIDAVLEKITLIRMGNISPVIPFIYRVIRTPMSLFAARALTLVIITVVLEPLTPARTAISLGALSFSFLICKLIDEIPYSKITKETSVSMSSQVVLIIFSMCALITAIISRGFAIHTAILVISIAITAVALALFRKRYAHINRIPALAIYGLLFSFASFAAFLGRFGAVRALFISGGLFCLIFLLYSPAENVSTEDDMIIGRPSIPLLLGYPAYYSLFFAVFFAITFYLARSGMYQFIILPCMFLFFAVFPFFKRINYPARYLIAQSYLPAIVAAFVYLCTVVFR